tara:strand:+ start:43 stop:252 length:210 start_codon:yes stop_codon:yes gene_type:complete
MPIYKVTSDVTPTWGDNISMIVRGIDVLDAIDIALKSYCVRDWTRANCRADIIPVDGKSEIIVEENMGS